MNSEGIPEVKTTAGLTSLALPRIRGIAHFLVVRRERCSFFITRSSSGVPMLSICPRDSGAVRCRPVTSSHLSFGGAPQVGQRTEIIFLGRVPLSSEDTAPCRMDKNDPPAIALMLCKKLGCANSVKPLQTHRQSWGGSRILRHDFATQSFISPYESKSGLQKQLRSEIRRSIPAQTMTLIFQAEFHLSHAGSRKGCRSHHAWLFELTSEARLKKLRIAWITDAFPVSVLTIA